MATRWTHHLGKASPEVVDGDVVLTGLDLLDQGQLALEQSGKLLLGCQGQRADDIEVLFDNGDAGLHDGLLDDQGCTLLIPRLVPQALLRRRNSTPVQLRRCRG